MWRELASLQSPIFISDVFRSTDTEPEEIVRGTAKHSGCLEPFGLAIGYDVLTNRLLSKV
jgi:hypothetical protein